jgi:hypothetical protein
VQVHEIIHNAALKVVLDTVDDDLFADVHKLQVCILVFATILVNGLVDLLVVFDAVPEVLSGLFGILATIVGASQLNITNVGHDELFIVAFALNKEDFNTVTGACVDNPFPALSGRISSIKNADNATGTEPGQHVSDGSLGSGAAFALSLGVVHVKEVGGGMRRIVAAVVADVEDLGRNGEPLQVALCYIGTCASATAPIQYDMQPLGYEGI